MLDLIQDESLVDAAWTYFREEQTANETYVPFIAEGDLPAIEKNADIQALFRERLSEFYYDPTKFGNYLEQLGVRYPQLADPNTD